jgi:polysaccharide biosynthesis protein PslH
LGFEVCAVAAAVRSDAGTATAGPDARLVATVPVAPPGMGPFARMRRTADLASAASVGPARNPWVGPYVAAGIEDAVLSAVERVRPVIILLRSTLAHLCPSLASLPSAVVLDAHDADSVMARSLVHTAPVIRKPTAVLRVGAARRAEEPMRAADEVWVTNEAELGHFAARLPQVNRVLVRNGIHVPPESPPPFPRHPELLLVGGFGHPPNLAAAEALVEQILPLTLERRRDVSVVLVGRDLPPDRLARWRDLPVHWTGPVPSVMGHYRRAAALVFPAPKGAGTPLKISEALALGTPVVASRAAVGDLGAQDRTHLLIRETAEEAASAIVSLLDDAGFAERLARSGQDWARENLSRASVLASVRRDSIVSARAP